MARHIRLASVVLAAVVVFATSLSAQSVARGTFVLIKDGQSQLSGRTVVAVPGDTVSISAGRINVNGAATSFTVRPSSVQWESRILPDETYFIAGDPLQLDANPAAWGMVPASFIVGIVQSPAR
jgi:hypothetical protein